MKLLMSEDFSNPRKLDSKCKWKYPLMKVDSVESFTLHKINCYRSIPIDISGLPVSLAFHIKGNSESFDGKIKVNGFRRLPGPNPTTEDDYPGRYVAIGQYAVCEVTLYKSAYGNPNIRYVLVDDTWSHFTVSVFCSIKGLDIYSCQCPPDINPIKFGNAKQYFRIIDAGVHEPIFTPVYDASIGAEPIIDANLYPSE